MSVVSGQPSRRERDNISYDLFEDLDAPGRFVFVEHWESMEAQQKHHHHGPHIQHFHAHGDKNVAGRDYVQLLRLVV